MKRSGYDYDGQYDWVLKKDGRDDQLRMLLKKDDPNSKHQHVPLIDIEERKDQVKPQGPQHKRQAQNKVIPNYNEFAN